MTSFKQIKLKINFVVGSLFYTRYALKSYLYSRQRDASARYFKRPPTKEAFDNPGKLLQAESTSRGANFYFEQTELEVCFLTPNLVRIEWKGGLSPVPYAIARHDWQEVETKLKQTGDRWTVSTAALQVIVTVDGSLTFCDASGQTLREELPPQRKDYGWIHRASLRQEECIYGLGERSFGLNLRQAKDKQQKPHAFRMWNYDAAGMYGVGSDPMYICIPIYMSLHSAGSYLIFYENSFEATFTFVENAVADFEGGALRYYFTAGSPAQLLERYTELTGRPPLPPRWALGYHQSHWGYLFEDVVRAEAKEFQARNLPLSAIHLDIDCQVGFRAFTIDPLRFPNLASFTRELRELGVQFIAINNPGIKCSRESNLFLEGQVLDGFCKYPDGQLVTAPVWPGWCVFPDFTHPKVRNWWSRQYQYLLDAGVAGFWHDMNEPAAFVSWGDRSLPKETRHDLDGRGGEHREAHNIYGLLQARAAYESLRQYCPHQRPFIVSRAGWAGLQRYSWTWTGDINSDWSMLRTTISTVVGLGLSGIPYSGSDIGGFQGNPSAELYLRWFQMATFHTFYRTHSSNNVANRTPWYYGEPYLSIMREFLQLRYRLMPYFYTLAWWASQKGYPPVRPVFWADSQDAALWNVDDAFLLGDALLVCPVLESGARMPTAQLRLTRHAILPKGYWYNFWDDTLLEGGQQVDLAAPLERIPLLVKAGSIIPMEENKQLILHVYPSVEGNAKNIPDSRLPTPHSLYSDAGDGYGEWRLDRFGMVRDENGLELSWETQGDYAFPYQKVRVHLHGIKLQQVWVDGTELACQGQQIECDPFHQMRLNFLLADTSKTQN
ncbi:glycoside hydrolase family 31 protein [Chroococcidiopsis sp. FACHB-1243]|uniref:glycoside hydrolase family 31 protein n=1 Tax=Chroococcidiopsis sp. [FACHB-1243] TaxID=2692781 RepID=UPI0017819D85|nr:glycoside hydrolase family 31 protein [Chroococcidiopsis sp. [FACHB-1243]]MBD2307743.1 glycoside hydrolase family 31 protein [Chroococcidiopsis sp. [FACHB-1243]]